ncbi:Guanine nucleotide exchange factor for Rab-3A [Exaiptasia diaphana]|nr:Guanine nucleotide exchange factor for Rab-3A [Exaiptasia diaphana]
MDGDFLGSPVEGQLDRSNSEPDVFSASIRPRTCSNVSLRSKPAKGGKKRPASLRDAQLALHKSLDSDPELSLSGSSFKGISNLTGHTTPTREEVKAHAYERLKAELQKAQQELKLKDEQCDKLSQVRNQLESELEELTASLFQEAHAMVHDARLKQDQAEKKYTEADIKVDMLQAEVNALKSLVITRTPGNHKGSRHRRHSDEQYSPCENCGSYDCDGAAPKNSGRCKGRRKSRDYHNPNEPEELKLKDEQCDKLSQVRNQLESELEELTASLFQEAHAMVHEARLKQDQAEKKYTEADIKVDMLQAEVNALKSLVITRTPGNHKGSRHRRHSDEQYSPCENCGSYDCDGAAPKNSARCKGRRKSRDYHNPNEPEVDVITFREFLQFMDEHSVSHDQPFLNRIYIENVAPCLEFPNRELANAIHAAIENNVLSMETIRTKPMFRRCALTGVTRFCRHRVKLSDNQDWINICRNSRDRIAAVCDFYTYIRYIQKGLVKADAYRILYFRTYTINGKFSVRFRLIVRVDVITFREFLQFMDEHSVSHDQPFLNRIYIENVAPCLEFPNRELANAIHAAIENNVLSMETIRTKPMFRRCALTDATRFCRHRVKLSDNQDWINICRNSRDRIAAVCDFYTYIRYIQKGLVKADATEIYWEIMRLRHKMTEARLGLTAQKPTTAS